MSSEVDFLANDLLASECRAVFVVRGAEILDGVVIEREADVSVAGDVVHKDEEAFLDGPPLGGDALVQVVSFLAVALAPYGKGEVCVVECRENWAAVRGFTRDHGEVERLVGEAVRVLHVQGGFGAGNLEVVLEGHDDLLAVEENPDVRR